MELKNCINCGAPLLGSVVCEYCGTDYGYNAKHDGFSGNFDDNATIGTIKLFGKEFKAYISNIQVDTQLPEIGRTIDGECSWTERHVNLTLEVVAYD